MLSIRFTNNSKVAPASVYIGFVPGAVGTVVGAVILNPKNPAKQTAVKAVNGSKGKGNWYTLDKLADGVGITSFSGRIYVCYGTPWTVAYPGYEPAQAVTDANFFLRYDKMELTFNGQPTDVADLTSIDYWSIPMTLITHKKGGGVAGTVKGLRTGVTAQKMFKALNALTTPPVSGIPGPGGVDGTPLPALVPGAFKQYGDGPKPLSTFARIIGPSSYPQVYPAPGAIPVTPYDLLGGYLDHLHEKFGPATKPDAVVKGLGKGVIARIAGNFAGVGPSVPATGPRSKQTYSLQATIDDNRGITLTGSTSKIKPVKMLYTAQDLKNPTGIYGGDAPFHLNGAATATKPANDVYGWIGGDLFSGLNIGAVGSTAQVNGQVVGSMESQAWFKLPTSSFFAKLQPSQKYYNQWAATLAPLSEAYNFAYTDRFAPVLVNLNPQVVDTLEIVLEDATVKMA